MSRLHAPKEANEKTNFIKAFCKKLAELGLSHLEDEQLLTTAEYYYQKAKQGPEDAAQTHARFVSESKCAASA